MFPGEGYFPSLIVVPVLSILRTQYSFYFREGDHKDHGINRRREEAALLVECLCLSGDRMNKDCAYSGDFCRLQNTLKRIGQKRPAKALAVPFLMDSKTANDHHGNGIGHIASDFPGSLRHGQGSCGETVIADDLAFCCANNVGSGRPASLIFKRAILEPVIEVSFP